MTRVSTTYRIEERLAGVAQTAWARGTVSREQAVELFAALVADDAASDAPAFGPHSQHRLIVLAEPVLRPGERAMALPGTTCAQTIDDGRRVCGRPVTDVVSWVDRDRSEYPPTTPEHPYRGFVIQDDGTIRYTAFYPHRVARRVCGSCADELMSWAATHLAPTRHPLAVTR